MAAAALPDGDLATLLTTYLHTRLTGFRDNGVGIIIAVGFAEGMFDDRHGQTCL